MLSLLITIIILGIIFYFIDQIPMEPVFKTGVRIIAIIIVLLLILQAFGVVTGLPALNLR